jgi:hypothetical protein
MLSSVNKWLSLLELSGGKEGQTIGLPFKKTAGMIR